MTKVDLITGFLGSGKTTFLKQYVRYLLSKGEKIGILEFDYGAINVDMMLLQEFDNLCDIEMVAGGCDYDCHLRRFKTKLISMGMKKYDRVIIEPSGIFDTDEFFDTLYEDPLDQWYEINSVFSIVDSGIHDLSEESEYILISQLAVSGRVILSKTQNHTEDEVNNTISYIRSVMKKYNMTLNDSEIITKPFSDYTPSDYEIVANCSYQSKPHIKENIIQENNYQSLYFMDLHLSMKRTKEITKTLFSSNQYGKILRVKGFIHEEESWYEFNFTKEEENTSPLKNGQDVIIVIGENLDKDGIKSLFQK